MAVNEQHTPGPWRTDGFHGRMEKITPQEDRGVCVAVMPIWEAEYEAEKNANARLIAAAPEMLEALKALAENARRLTACIGSLDHACDLGCGRAYDVLRDRTIQAEAIIRKAEGRS